MNATYLGARTLQVRDVGGDEPEIREPLVPDWNRPVTFLIHGYNTTEREAKANFDNFLRTMDSQSVLPVELRTQSWVVFWQGFARLGLGPGRPWWSFLTYPFQIPSALIAAKALKDFIDKYGGPSPEVNIIAHSLGCRAALELLEAYAISPGPRPRFRVVVLLAAAVPVNFLEEGRLRRGARLPERKEVLFSGRDLVLQGPFRAAHSARLEGCLPEAVGTGGKPLRHLWSRSVRTRNGHSGYFKDSLAASEAARAFVRPVPVSLPVFAPPTPIGSLPDHKLPETTLPVRGLGGIPSTRAA